MKAQIIALGGWVKTIRNFIKKLHLSEVVSFSAQAAFFLLLSLFPFIMLLASIVSAFPFLTESAVHELISGVIPSVFSEFIASVFAESYRSENGFTITVTAVAALWSASRGVLAMTRGLNHVCDCTETRGWIYVRLRACFYTLGFLLTVVLAAVLVVFGQSISQTVSALFPQFQGIVRVIYLLRSLISFALVALLFLIFYLFLPDRKSTLRHEWFGAVLAAGAWMGFSQLYAWYITSFATTGFYGSLTTVVFFMLWLYVGMYIFFLGAQLSRFRQKEQQILFFGKKTP